MINAPRRIRLACMTPAELSIYAATQAVEAAGADTLLTEAINLLQAAREKVADYVDAQLAPQPLPAAPAVEGPVACDCGVSVCGESPRSDVACRGQLRIVEVGNERHLCEAHWDAGTTPPAETGGRP